MKKTILFLGLVIVTTASLVNCGKSSGGGGSSGAAGTTTTASTGQTNTDGTNTDETNTDGTDTSDNGGTAKVVPKLDLTGALALALYDNGSGLTLAEQDKGLKKMTVSGELKSAFSEGSLSVQKFLIAPNGKLYLLLDGVQSIDDSEATCLLVEVNTSTNAMICIESGNNFSVTWEDSNGYSPIQFDNVGNIYYAGISEGNVVFRKYSSGTKTDLINDNIYLIDVAVGGDGSVILSGQTNTSNQTFTRRIKPDGSLQSIFANAASNWVQKFPDGNIYIGILHTNYNGIAKFDIAAGALLSTWYASGTRNGQFSNPPVRTIDLDDASHCGDATFKAKESGVCDLSTTSPSDFYKTANGQVFSILHGSGSSKTLTKIFPAIESVNSTVVTAGIAKSLVNSLVIAGLDSAGTNRLMLYDTSAQTELDLLQGAEIEVYHISYKVSENKIYFDGLRFSDNKYVIGYYDIDNSVMSAVPVSQKLKVFESL